jgi:hypothetical protein
MPIAKSVSDIAPRLLLTVPKRIASKSTVHEALSNRRWVSDIKGALTLGALVDYLHLWNIGMPYLTWCCSLILKISTSFQLPQMANILQARLIMAFSLGLLLLNTVKGFGNLGHLLSVGSSFGWLLKTGAGLQTDWKKEDRFMLPDALFVIRSLKPSTIYWFHFMCLLQNVLV